MQMLMQTLNSIRSVELYIPVPEHRLNWRGDADLTVSSYGFVRSGIPGDVTYYP